MKTLLAYLPPLALALAALGTGCSSKEKTCPSDQALCGESCVSLQSDANNCGACGHTCGAGQGCLLSACVDCSAGGQGCKADVLAACFNANQVRAFDTTLAPVGAPVTTSASGPGSFATLQGAIYVVDVTGGAVDEVTPPTATRISSVPGGSYNDLEHLGAYRGLLYVSNAAVGSFVAIDPVGKKVVGEVSLSVGGDAPNPLGFDFANGKAYVALAAGVGASPNGLAVVDLSVPPPWTTKPAVSRIDLSSFASAGVNPGVSRVLASGDETRVFVTMNNLYDATFQPVPGATGRLVVVNTSTNAVVGGTAVDLGTTCLNPSGMALSGTTLWIACGYTVFNGTFTAGIGVDGALLPVDVSGATPVPGTAIPVANHALGNVTICGTRGYAGTADSGTLVSFDPSARTVTAASETACPADPVSGFSAVFDVACAP